MNLNFRKKILISSLCVLFIVGNAFDVYSASANNSSEVTQQLKKISGIVVDQNGEPIIGANVLEKGTTTGTITDFDGKFSLSVKKGAVLTISFIGYKTKEIKLINQNNIKVVLDDDSESLDEVVVIGYGTQKKKLITGATVQVKGDDIAKLNTTNVLGALQSQSPGVQIIQSNGQPGSGFKVNVRGLGTMGNSSPLYVIDGVAGGDINNLNPSDIESIDVLKDAASAAIYGARAANGVILVTTKQGKLGKLQISYDGYVGAQYLYKKPDILNGQEYMYAQDLVAFNEGTTPIDWASVLPEKLYTSLMDGSWKGTNWIDESYHKGALTQNHAINLTGGSEASKFSLGFAYTNQDGIFGGETQSKYQRYTARLNSDHVLYKKDKLDIIKLGETMTFSHTQNGGIALGNMYWNNMYDLLTGCPLLPAYNSNGGYYLNNDKKADGWALGNAANPLAGSATCSQGLNDSRSYNLNFSTYVTIQPIKNLFLKSQFGYRVGSSSYRSYDMITDNGSTTRTKEAVNQNMSMWSNLSLENTIAYSFNVGKHNADFVIGNSIEKNGFGINVNAGASNTIFENSFEHAYLSNTKPQALSDIHATGWPSNDSKLASFFGRASYNYNEKYMLQFTLRADGSSNFAKGKRWGYFPSASIGWVITNEKFMESTKNWMDFLKLRASWGQNGNCSIDNFQYMTTFAFDEGSGYLFGTDNKDVLTTGAHANVLKNPDVTWETSEQLNLGFDARFINSRLGVALDYYEKKTKDWLLRAPIQSVYGLNAPYINGGDVKNSGIEIGLNWNDQVGKDFRYGANLNFSYNKNKVTKISNSRGIINGPVNVLLQGSDEIFRAQVGRPLGYFYGMKTDGVFQNQAQIDEWSKTHQDAIHGKIEPGDLIFVDNDGDGKITTDDRTMIGDPHPDYNLGFSFNCEYKGFDFSLTSAGAFGQDILRTTNKGDYVVDNLNKKLLYKSWNGEGTSNKIPKLTKFTDVDWMTMSDMWLENGDYLKIQNITIGYDFKKLFTKLPFQQLRLYLSAQNLYTFTNYSGMDPEIGTTGTGDENTYSWASGIDNGFYPSPRTYLVGVNIKF